jgi:hypothetical protein
MPNGGAPIGIGGAAPCRPMGIDPPGIDPGIGDGIAPPGRGIGGGMGGGMATGAGLGKSS